MLSVIVVRSNTGKLEVSTVTERCHSTVALVPLGEQTRGTKFWEGIGSTVEGTQPLTQLRWKHTTIYNIKIPLIHLSGSNSNSKQRALCILCEEVMLLWLENL